MPKGKGQTKSAKQKTLPASKQSKTSKATVANVNISPTTRFKSKQKTSESVSASKNEQIRPEKRKTTGKVVFDEIVQPLKKLKRSASTGKASSKESHNISHGNHRSPSANFAKSTEANFIEDDQFVQMEVEANDDSMFQTESSETEVSVNDSNSSEGELSGNSEVEEVDGGSQAEAINQQLETLRSKNRNSATEDIRSNQQKIQEIDEEMLRKLTELQEMMVQGSLTESVKVIDGMKSVTANRIANEGKSKSTSNKTNKNQNATWTKETVTVNKATKARSNASEATIYKQAVNKRACSSSDEVPDADTSDEFVHALSFNNFVDQQKTPPCRTPVGTPTQPTGQFMRDQPLTSKRDDEVRQVQPPQFNDTESSDEEITPD